MDTPLGDVDLTAPSVDVESWRTDVASAARVTASVWGRGDGPVRVTVCDDTTFASVADGLDAGTAAATTTDGVFLGPALAHSVTPQGRVVVIAHELTHARLGDATHDTAPWWLEEGTAEWTAAGAAPGLTASRRWPTLRERCVEDAVPNRPPSGTGSETGQLGYEWAHAYVEHLVQAVGVQRFRSLVHARSKDSTAEAQSLTSHARPFDAWLRDRFDLGAQ